MLSTPLICSLPSNREQGDDISALKGESTLVAVAGQFGGRMVLVIADFWWIEAYLVDAGVFSRHAGQASVVAGVFTAGGLWWSQAHLAGALGKSVGGCRAVPLSSALT